MSPVHLRRLINWVHYSRLWNIQNFCICFSLSIKGIIPVETYICFVIERQRGLEKKTQRLNALVTDIIWNTKDSESGIWLFELTKQKLAQLYKFKYCNISNYIDYNYIDIVYIGTIYIVSIYTIEIDT